MVFHFWGRSSLAAALLALAAVGVQCSAKKNLHVRHLTYEYHGLEHEHLESLAQLCKNCRAQVHDLRVQL